MLIYLYLVKKYFLRLHIIFYIIMRVIENLRLNLNLSQKCQYAVRAILELSKRHGQGAISAGEIAASQAIPQRFLEIILNELKPTGLVDSRRGVQGGFYLTADPKDITVGRIIRLVEGPLDPVRCTGDKESAVCPLKDKCALVELWNQAKEAVEKVYDAVTFQDLVEREKNLDRQSAANYCI
jgi:Rrf2 family transcriptional regulator, cysteine metabolism repressor